MLAQIDVEFFQRPVPKTSWIYSKSRSNAEHLVAMAATLCGLLGLTVIAGWLIHIPFLVQVVPTFTPMQFNTALSFVLCSVALHATLTEKRRIAAICATSGALLAVSNLYEDIFGLNLGIDELLWKPSILTVTVHPGRMASNTAVAFVLFTFTVLAFSWPRFRPAVVLTTALVVGAFGIVPLFGYPKRSSVARTRPSRWLLLQE